MSAVSSLAALAATQPRLVAAASSASEVLAIGTTGNRVVLRATDVEDLRAGLAGRLLQPQQPEYESARKVWNGAFDSKPALIARCSNANDVVRTVTFARDHRLLVAVRGGGHSFPGHSTCEGGLLIDLTEMDGIRVDPKARTALVQPGIVLGQFDRETQALPLAAASAAFLAASAWRATV